MKQSTQIGVLYLIVIPLPLLMGYYIHAFVFGVVCFLSFGKSIMDTRKRKQKQT